MKLKFRNSDGWIIAVGEMPDLKAGAGETVEGYEGVIPSNIEHFRRVSPGVIQKLPQVDIDSSEASKKNSRSQGKKGVLQKLNLSKSDIPGLIALIQDGNDD